MGDDHRNVSREEIVSFSERHGIPTRIAKAILRIHGSSTSQCDAAAIAYRNRAEGQIVSRSQSAPGTER